MNCQLDEYYCIGIMSGSSLDGLDIAYCKFVFEKDGIKSYEIIDADTCEFPLELMENLKNIQSKTVFEFCEFDRTFGHWIGKQVNDFKEKHSISKIDFIASHGHTIFHNPGKKLTVQIGHGASICAETKCPVISDFRSLDVAFGGQGAPLVPIGDKLLFTNYEFCLNLGGISNISFESEEKRIAFDNTPFNIIFNHLAKLYNEDLEYDKDGEISLRGSTDQTLYDKIRNLSYFNKPIPKSLSKEWIVEEIIPLLAESQISIEDKMRTCSELFADEIAECVIKGSKKDSKILVTGGGAFNQTFIKILGEKLSGKCKIVLPDLNIIKFKEALIFAFLGALRIRKQINCLSSVTGAKLDSIGGNIYEPF